MCGISGFYGPFDPSVLRAMDVSLAHRGPDDSGQYHDPEHGIGLVHRRLSIIEMSALGHQPMWSEDGSVCIVYNGEMYNYKEVRTELLESGHYFRSQSDTEVLLALYLRDGPEMLRRVNGIFAFAIWDSRSENLFLARDSFGVKPLYYAALENGFVFASEIKAILNEKSIERELDFRALLQYMTYLWCPAPETMLKSVKKLAPGEAVLVQRGRVRKSWNYEELSWGTVRCENQTLAGRGLVSHLKESVRRQLVADVPVGAFLSGGLDSSAVAAMAREAEPGLHLECFTIDCDFGKEGFADDLPYARRVARHLGVPLHEIRVGPEMAYELPRMIYHLDEPQADLSALNVMYISKLAREQGIKVLLSGAGGDDIFSGYRRHYALLMEKWWSWLPVRVRKALSEISENVPQSTVFGRRWARAFRFANLEGDDRLISYFHWIDPRNTGPLLNSEACAEIGRDVPGGTLKKSLARLNGAGDPLNRMLYLEIKHFLADHNLAYTDKMSMVRGVEVRVPFLDPDLVAFAGSLPARLKHKGRQGKWIFKKSMEPYLPRENIYRPKSGFGVPLRHWLHNQLKELRDEILSERSIRKRGFFNYPEVRKRIQADQAGKMDCTYSIFSLMCIELWCRIFLDDEGVSSFSLH